MLVIFYLQIRHNIYNTLIKIKSISLYFISNTYGFLFAINELSFKIVYGLITTQHFQY